MHPLFHRKKISFKKIDLTLIITVLVLCIYGLIVLYSATYSYGPGRYMTSQIVATVVGVFMIIFLLTFNQDLLKQLHIPIYLVMNILLVLVLILGTGDDSWGARSWLRLGPVNFQPSEFAKIVRMKKKY